MCSKKIKEIAEFRYNTVNDIQGNSYRTIKVKGLVGGEQEWFADNLAVSCFRNGDIIRQAQTIKEWRDACENKEPVWCYFNDNFELGRLYNVYSIIDPRGLAPEGFQIPNYIDFSILGLAVQEIEPADLHVGNINGGRINPRGIATGGLKMMAKEYWKKKGENISGLSIIGAGGRSGVSPIFINPDFFDYEKTCRLWLRPHGTYLKTDDMNSSQPLGEWFDFEILNTLLPFQEFSLLSSNMVPTEVYNSLKDKLRQSSNLAYDRNSKWNEIYAKYYPIDNYTEQTFSSINKVIQELIFDLNGPTRRGLRTVTFSSGKDQIWFSSSQDLAVSNVANYEGCYCRPFRYT